MQETEEILNDSTESGSPPTETKRARALRLQRERHAADPEAPYGRKKDGTPKGKTGPQNPAEIVSLPATIYSATVNQDRINEAAEMMRNMTFVRGKTVKELAKKWGITVNYAKHMTSLAWKLCCEEVTDREMLGSTIGEAMLKMVQEGAKEGARTEAKKMAVLAAKVLLDMSPGLRAPQEHNVGISRKDNLPDDPVELERIARKMLERTAEEGRQEYVAMLEAS